MEFEGDLIVRICETPKYKAQIDMGGYIVSVNHTYTEEQIKHIKEYFGWDVTNL